MRQPEGLNDHSRGQSAAPPTDHAIPAFQSHPERVEEMRRRGAIVPGYGRRFLGVDDDRGIGRPSWHSTTPSGSGWLGGVILSGGGASLATVYCLAGFQPAMQARGGFGGY